jgi:magnesium chelatase subunit D
MPEGGVAPLDVLVDCMALHAELRGLLLLDDQPGSSGERLAVVSQRLSATLRAVTGRPVREVRLGAGTSDDDLWAQLRLRPDPARQGVLLEHVPQPLLEQPRAGEPHVPLPLVTIPDLAIVSVPAARAIVAVAGAAVAVTERDGFSRQWEPTGAWVAVCDPAKIGSISPHLLDRFPLRASVSHLVMSATTATTDPGVPGSREGSATVWDGAPWPTMARPMIAEIARRSSADAQGLRRPIAYARLAVACARRRGGERVEWDDVEMAMSLLAPPRSHPAADGPDTGGSRAPEGAADEAGSGADQASRPARRNQTVEDDPTLTDALTVADEAGLGLHVEHGGPAELTHQVPLPAGPAIRPPLYPEDDAEPLREIEPLRLLWTASHTVRQLHGQVIGTRTATDLRDIAVVPSLLRAAARHIARRPSRTSPGGPLLIGRGDLRAYRRAPVPEQMLILLLDHTARPGASWAPTLAGYLEWAYVQRARLAVIEIGVADGSDARPQLHAERFLARGILDPRVEAALAAPVGTATPLAHGLDLAQMTVRHVLRQGNALVREVYLVIATDGRGNVPLAASRLGESPPARGAAGVQDAIEVARRLRGFRQLVVHVLDLGSAPYADLPTRLAEASGAVLPETPRE